jgi:hypothetical protein
MIPPYSGWVSPQESGGVLVCAGASPSLPQGYVTKDSYALSSCEISVDVTRITFYPLFVFMISETNNIGGPSEAGFNFRIQADPPGSGSHGVFVVAYVNGQGQILTRDLPYVAGRWQMKISMNTIKAYVGGAEVASYAVPSGQTLNLYVSLWEYGNSPTSNVGFDNFNLAISGGTPQQKGTLRIFASYNGQYVAVPVTVSVSGSTVKSGTTTTDANSPLIFNDLAPGSYTVSGSYQTITKTSDPQTVEVGKTLDCTLNFAGTPPTPPGGAWVWPTISFPPYFRTLLLLVGVALSGICGILLVAPSKKPAPAPSPAYTQ